MLVSYLLPQGMPGANDVHFVDDIVLSYLFTWYHIALVLHCFVIQYENPVYVTPKSAVLHLIKFNYTKPVSIK